MTIWGTMVRSKVLLLGVTASASASASISINQHWSASITINQHQSASTSISINQHQSVSININQHKRHQTVHFEQCHEQDNGCSILCSAPGRHFCLTPGAFLWTLTTTSLGAQLSLIGINSMLEARYFLQMCSISKCSPTFSSKNLQNYQNY